MRQKIRGDAVFRPVLFNPNFVVVNGEMQDRLTDSLRFAPLQKGQHFFAQAF